MKNIWIKILCFGQNLSDYQKEYNEKSARYIFIAIVINLWSLVFLMPILVVFVGSLCWEQLSVLLQPYSKTLFAIWCILITIFLATMHFAGISMQMDKK